MPLQCRYHPQPVPHSALDTVHTCQKYEVVAELVRVVEQGQPCSGDQGRGHQSHRQARGHAAGSRRHDERGAPEDEGPLRVQHSCIPQTHRPQPTRGIWAGARTDPWFGRTSGLTATPTDPVGQFARCALERTGSSPELEGVRSGTDRAGTPILSGWMQSQRSFTNGDCWLATMPSSLTQGFSIARQNKLNATQAPSRPGG